MGLWRMSKWLGICLVLGVALVARGWAAEPFPPPQPELPEEVSDVPRPGDWPAYLSEEERAVVENLEFLEMMELLENLEVIRNWDVLTQPLPSDYETTSPQGEASSYGDLGPQ